MTIPFEPIALIVAATAAFAAYVMFGITSFGAALITVPVLSHFYPLEFALPTLVMLDASAALAVGTRFSRDADFGELKWMAPTSLVGAVLGVTLLVNLPRQATLVAFGIFLIVYGGHTLRMGSDAGMLSRRWAPIAGMTGGITGALFGIGGPPYAIYLSRRFTDNRKLRATLSSMVLLSTSIRAVVFIVGGLMLADRILMYGLLLPFALSGLWVGTRLHGRISRDALLRVMSIVLLVMGISILVRTFVG